MASRLWDGVIPVIAVHRSGLVYGHQLHTSFSASLSLLHPIFHSWQGHEDESRLLFLAVAFQPPSLPLTCLALMARRSLTHRRSLVAQPHLENEMPLLVQSIRPALRPTFTLLNTINPSTRNFHASKAAMAIKT